MEKLRYGIVGAGSVAYKKHLAGYAGLPQVELVAVCDADPARAGLLAGKYGIPNVFTDYRAMFERAALDLISVCTPNHLHEPVSVLALASGINVHCEKPLALNAAEVRRIIAAKNASGRKLLVGLNNRFTNASFFLRNYLSQGNLGEIYHVRCGWRRRRGIPGRGGWFTDRALAGGGPLIDLGVHLIDLALFLIDNWTPRSVTASTYCKFRENVSRNSWAYGTTGEGVFDVEDMAVGFARLAGGITLDFEFSWAANIERDRKYCEILGTRGGILLADDRVKIFTEMSETVMDIYPNTDYSHEAANEFRHFVACLTSDVEPSATPEQAYEVMRIVDAAYLSAATGQEVHLES